MTDEADEALMAAYQRGDLAAFEALVVRHEKPLWNFLRRFVGDPAAAEDLLQETFLRVVRHAPEWQPTARVSTWLYTIARNLCTDHARRMSHRRATSLDGGGAEGARDGDGSGPRPLDRIAGPDPGGEAAAAGQEIAARIEAAVAALPPDQREVFLMREVMDLPFAEIAAAVGASEPTVKSRMRYALERLRAALGELREPERPPAPARARVESQP
jgi:RNA polymerase sigma-70 factor (ECF subfamily)